MDLQDSVQRSLQNPAEKILQIFTDSQRLKTWEVSSIRGVMLFFSETHGLKMCKNCRRYFNLLHLQKHLLCLRFFAEKTTYLFLKNVPKEPRFLLFIFANINSHENIHTVRKNGRNLSRFDRIEIFWSVHVVFV